MEELKEHIATDKLVPQLRFVEFESNWVRSTIGEVCSMKAGSYMKASEISSEQLDGLFPCYGGNGLRGFTKSYNKNGKYTLIGRQGAHCGNVKLVEGKFHATEHAVVVNLNNQYDTDWIYYLLLISNLNQYATGQAQPGLSVKSIENIGLIVPTLPEQQKIASFLSSVDTKLQQLTQKKELLAQYKKGVMQQLFSQQLRFKRPDGSNYPDWEEKRIGEVLFERDIKKPKSEEYPLMAFMAYKGVSPKGDRYNREFLVSDGDNKKYKQTEYGDFIYSSNNLETGSIGLNRYGNASISPVYSIFRIEESCEIEFMSNYLVRKEFINKMIRFRQGVIYGQWRIHESEFLKIIDKIPSKEEQQQIANYLSGLDTKIESVAQQITQTQQFKKGLLQQMFV